MVDIVFDEGRSVDKFIGDAVIAVFLVHRCLITDDATCSVRVAMRMMEESGRFNDDRGDLGAAFPVHELPQVQVKGKE
ncbi:hypothetical protein [Mycobacterium lepromatosis]|uniref:hypothetical protein n=1 Tax=Mycobacterium lepromatosis TaxID=480418 RepID=UPI0005F7ACFD|nr:hypothetical protein [Mycobacterium lepromatosis]